MERFTYRSTSLIGLQAELRRNELLAEAQNEQFARVGGRRGRGRPWLSFPWRRSAR